MARRRFKYIVITKIPDEYDEGNMCDRVVECKDIRQDMSCGHNKETHFPESFVIKDEVFALGEIIIVDSDRGEYGRELDGHQRRPSKWYVETETVDSIEKAVALAEKVIKDEWTERTSK